MTTTKRLTLLSFIFLWSSLSIAQETNILKKGEEPPGQTIKINAGPETSFKLGGALWLRSAIQDWQQESNANRDGFYFDQFRLALTGEHGIKDETKLFFSAQVRWWSYQFLVQHMWFGVKFNESNQLQFGVTQVPFGALPSASSSFWYSLNYNLGFEGDRDAGFKYIYDKEGTNFQLGFFRNAEYNNPTRLNRWTSDLVVFGEQQNFERNQGNVRIAHEFGHGTEYTSEFGLSGQVGELPNQTTGKSGVRWATAFHYLGNYNNWNVNFQAMRYEFNPENPDGVDDRLMLMGASGDRRLVASKATTFVGSVRRYWDIDWWLFTKLNAYVEYSTVLKDVNEFYDSKLFNPGFVLQAGPFFIWTDFLFGQNAWGFNDSETNSGLGAGSINPTTWEFRYNMSLQWFF